MRRLGPRPLRGPLETLVAEIAPASTLGRVQERWASAAGSVIAAEAVPVAERAGVVTVACRSAAWAHELGLLSPDLTRRLNEALASATEPPPVRELRFVTRSGGAP